MVRTLASAALRCTLTSQRRVARSLTPAHSHERRCASLQPARRTHPRTNVYALSIACTLTCAGCATVHAPSTWVTEERPEQFVHAV